MNDQHGRHSEEERAGQSAQPGEEQAQSELSAPEAEPVEQIQPSEGAEAGAEAGREEWPEAEERREDRVFPIVGIGASAGGLESLEKLFKAVPEKPNMAFVVIVHLLPNHESLMPEIIQRSTAMKVEQITNGMPVEENHVYVIPPNHQVTLIDSAFRLEKTDSKSPTSPIDKFFRSLAERYGESAVGVVLSGAGSDGTLGVREIKERFGLVMAEDPETAAFRSMPDSAIRTGLVDKVLPAGEMPKFLIDVTKQERQIAKRLVSQKHTLEWVLRRIFFTLRSRTGHDFSGYKRNTIVRRIERRMSVRGLDSIAEYAEYLHENPPEVANLFKELLIGVTRFFREPESFDLLKKEVLPDMLAAKGDRGVIRIWVPGVSTGEEAYSIAMVLQEYKQETGAAFTFQIFATDIDDEAIDEARRGVYPRSISEDVNPERLRRFFEREDERYRVQRQLRESVVFAVQNVIKDPPFTRIDLISCRNLLIYLSAEVQKKLMPVFHYALRPHGYLILGTSESVSDMAGSFQTINSKWKVFKVRETSGTGMRQFELPATASYRDEAVREPGRRKQNEETLPQMTTKHLLEQYAPPAAVIDPKGNVVYIHGRTGKYLEPAQGRVNLNVFDMAREGLRLHLQTLVRKVAMSRMPAERGDVRVRTNGDEITIKVVVRPLRDKENNLELLVITFEPAPELQPRPSGEPGEGLEEFERKQLEAELSDTRENLHTTIEELEASNEELQSTNEEFQSTNEELQSANEELETSREELQAINEEMTTANRELLDRVNDLAHSHEELQAFLNGIGVATVFLDNRMRVQKFTAQARDLIHLIESDKGRPLSDITYDLEDRTLVEDARRVLDTMVYQEKEVRTTHGHWYLRRIIPFRSSDDKLAGVVINFVDINELKKSARQLDWARSELEHSQFMVQTVREGLVLLDMDLTVLLPNRSLCSLLRARVDEITGQGFFTIGEGKFATEEMKGVFDRIQRRTTAADTLEMDLEFPGLGRAKVVLYIRRVYMGEQSEDRILVEFLF